MVFNTFNDKEDSDYLFDSECKAQFLGRPLVTFLKVEGQSIGAAFTVGIRREP